MKIINKILIGLCVVAALLIAIAIYLSAAKASYPFATAKWYSTPQQVLDSLGLTMADVKINSSSANDLAKDEKSLLSYEANKFLWEGIEGELFLTFSEKGLIWVELRSDIANFDTALDILTKIHSKAKDDDVGNYVWGEQMGQGNGITLFKNGEQLFISFYAG